MCGIWASVGHLPPRAVISVVAHRGPDGEGWVELRAPGGPVVLAHRWLAVVDRDAKAAQPFRLPGRELWLSYNGELYNHTALRDQLERAGHSFVTTSDTEVLVRAYAEWGTDCLARLEGMFAFALFDDEAKTLFVARDRFGIKPLYIYNDARGICFASEIKQLLELPGAPRRINAARALEFLSDGSTDKCRETLFDGVWQLRAGEALLLDLKCWSPRAPVQPRCWYSLPEPGSVRMPACEAAGRYRNLLEQSVREHSKSIGPLGIALSGGLDSASLACLATVDAARSSIAAAFSACYEEPELDERRYLDAIVLRTGLANYRVFPQAHEVLPALEDLIWYMDEPFGGTSVLAQWLVFRLARSHSVRVVLSGQGADEQLGGYANMLAVRASELHARHRVVARGTIWDRIERPARIPPSAPAAALSALIRPPAKPSTSHYRNSLGELCSYLVTTGSLPMLLRLEDRNSMAHGVESRVPFLDRRLVELAVGLGGEHKIVARRGKHLLRVAMADMLPPVILGRRTKVGFTTPEPTWIAGPLRVAVTEGALAAARQWPQLISESGVARLVEQLESEASTALTLWRIFVFGAWARRFHMSGIG